MNEVAKSYPELILGFIFISVVLGALRFIFLQYVERKKISLQKIELMNNILKFNLNKPNARQKFTTEQTFFAVFGKAFAFDEIKALLNYDSPSEAVLLYLQGRRFLRVSNSGKSITLNGKYKKLEIFKIDFYLQDAKFLLLYILFSLATIFPITVIYTIYKNNSWFADSLGLINIFWVFIAGAIASMLVMLAIISMLQSGKIAYAFKLVAKNS